MTNKTKQAQSSTSTTANTYGHEPGASSPDIDAVRDFEFSHDPRVSYSFARAAERSKDVYANPLGGATTPQLRDAVQRTTAEDLGQQEGQAYAEEGRNLQGLDFAKKMDVAQMTAPRFVQQGQSGSSSGTATAVQSQSPIGPIVSGASSMALML